MGPRWHKWGIYRHRGCLDTAIIILKIEELASDFIRVKCHFLLTRNKAFIGETETHVIKRKDYDNWINVTDELIGVP